MILFRYQSAFLVFLCCLPEPIPEPGFPLFSENLDVPILLPERSGKDCGAEKATEAEKQRKRLQGEGVAAERQALNCTPE